MKTYLSREEALRCHDVTEDELDGLIENNHLDVITLRTIDGKETIIYDDSLAAYVAERDITPEKFDHLRDNLMGIGEAAREYRIGQGTISKWVQQGLLEVKATDKNKKLISEADVAYLVELGRAKKMRPGKKVFSS